ncbi:drug resistance transporter, EmrB/QacA subfamily [Clostridium sp. USBA 49]|uniref:MFS transporter n=1 Tax=Clostridium sp. USBA 49 TaxID=1881060 RepID=UPI00099A51CC|nr:MFS transporter [Clostridium sp. USBA 49]SKA85276.1 drug resistance transporter, EmrB/QacA subfamily [Clostridium sp. USBA 49]
MQKKKDTYKNRWTILATVMLLTFMSVLDSNIVNVALPVMSKDLSVSMAQIGWVVTSYLITIVGTILVFGRLGDIKGKTRIFKFGIVVFTLGSMLCGLSHSLIMLAISRVIQAIGAAATMATNQGIITHVFPANERGRALGLNGTFVALGAMVGPSLGGFIADKFSWEYIFLINVPIGILAFILAIKNLPKSSKNSNESLDIKGAILFALSVISLFGSIVQGQEVGYNNILIILGFILSIITFILFIILEKNIKEPLLHLELFQNKLFSLSVFCAFLSFIAISTSNIILPFYLQDVIKLSPSYTGLVMMFSPVILAIVAPLSGYLSDKIGSEILTFFGLSLTSIGLSLMVTLNQYSSIVLLVVFIGVTTLGNGMFQSPNNSLVMSTVPKNKLGIAGSINGLVRNLGMTVGVSLSTTLLYSMMSRKMGYHVSSFINGREDVFMYGMKWVYASAAIICACGAILTAYRLYGSKDKERNKNS